MRAGASRQRNGLDHGAHLLAGAAAGAGAGLQPVGDGLRQDGLHVIGLDVVASLQQGAGAGGTQHRQAGTGGEAFHEPLP